MNITREGRDAIRKAWGNPKEVVNAALDELFRHRGLLSFEVDDQIRYARDIGILAGEYNGGMVETFFEIFQEIIDSNEG